MVDKADPVSDYKTIILDRMKFFKSEYEPLPIPNMDPTYFDSHNTINLMQCSQLLGAIFISHKQDIYILEKENVEAFFKRERKTFKRIVVGKDESELIRMINLSPCEHMMAVVIKNNINIYSVKDMVSKGTATLLTKFSADNDVDFVNWIPQLVRGFEDSLLAIDNQKKLYSVDLKNGQNKSADGHQITCAAFSRTCEHIVALNAKNELIIFISKTLAPIRIEGLPFIASEQQDITVFNNISEIKQDLWLLQGAVNDGDDPAESSRHVYMINGDIVKRKITESKIQLFDFIFTPLYGADIPVFVGPYYQSIYISQRDVIVCGNSEGNEVTMIFNKAEDPKNTDLKNYTCLEPGSETIISLKLKKDLSVNKLRGLAYYTTRLSDRKSFEYVENDEEKEMCYPPMFILLASSGEIAKYAFVDKRPTSSKSDLLTDPKDVSALNRKLEFKDSTDQPSTAPQPVITNPDRKETPTIAQNPPIVSKDQTIPKDTNPILQKPNNIPTQPFVSSIKPPTIIQKETVSNQQQTITDPRVINYKNTRERVVNNIKSLSYDLSELTDGIKANIIEPIVAERKLYYSELRRLENKLDECKFFTKQINVFSIRQKRLTASFEETLVSLGDEAKVIKETIKRQKLTKENLKIYKNAELSSELKNFQLTYNSLQERFDFADTFLVNYANLKAGVPSKMPALGKSSPKKAFYEASASFQVINQDETISLNMDSIANTLRMSRSSKYNDKQDLTQSKNDSMLKSSMRLGRMKFSRSERDAPKFDSLAVSLVKPPEHDTDLEYHKQLTQLHRSFIKALEHSSLEINEMKATLEGWQKPVRSPTKSTANGKSTAQKESSNLFKKKRLSRRIYCPDSFDDFHSGDEDFETPTETKTSFFARILDDAQSSDRISVKVPTDPYKKWDNYTGPSLTNLYTHFKGNNVKKSTGMNIKGFMMPTQPSETIKPKPPQTIEPNNQPKIGAPSGPPGMFSKEENKTNINDLKNKTTNFFDFNASKQTEAKPSQGNASLTKSEVKGPKIEEEKKNKEGLNITVGPPKADAQSGKQQDGTPLFPGHKSSRGPEVNSTSANNKEKNTIDPAIKASSSGPKGDVKVPNVFAATKKPSEVPEKEGSSLDSAFDKSSSPSVSGGDGFSFISDDTQENKDGADSQKAENKSQSIKREEQKTDVLGGSSQSRMGVKPNLSVVKDLASLGNTQTLPTQEKKAGRRPFDVSGLLQGVDDEPSLADALPPLVRDDSYISKKPEPAPDFFKTMSFGPRKQSSKNETKEDIVAQLAASQFSRKVDKKGPTEEKKEDSENTAQSDSTPVQGSFSANPTETAAPQGQSANKPTPPQSQPSFLQNMSQTAPASGSSGVLFSQPGTNMNFLTSSLPNQNIVNPQSQVFKPQSGGGNMFAIPSNNAPAVNAGVQGQRNIGSTFGQNSSLNQGFSGFGNPSQMNAGHGHQAGGGFGQVSSGLGQSLQRQPAPQNQAAPRIFGSGSSAFGSSVNTTSSSNPFSAAIQNQGNPGFLATNANPTNFNFTNPGGNSAFSSIRKSKMT